MKRKPSILVVCAHFHGDRTAKRDRDFMQPSAGLHIASLVDPAEFDVRLHHEMWHGTYDTTNVPNYDIVFLTGLQKDFDRMRQLAYFFKRTGAITVAGGSVCTLFPEFATAFFDVVSSGGVDSTAEILRDFRQGSLKRIYRSPQTRVTDYRINYRLLADNGIDSRIHLIEASRGCNFTCDFCVIPAEKARHTPYGVARVADMIDAAIKHSPRFSFKKLCPFLWFIDNNFANDKEYARELCAHLRAHSRVKGWGALVTQDILRNHDLISEMARSKCRALFTGLESLDLRFLESHHKRQNAKYASSILQDIEHAQRKQIMVIYGYLFDPRIATVEGMQQQLQAIVRSPILPFPSFVSFVSPLLGTEFFWKCADKGELRPNLRLRDLEGQCIAYGNCLSPDDELKEFAQKLFKKIGDLIDVRQLVINFLKAQVRVSPRFCYLYYLNYRNTFRIFHLIKKRSVTAGRNYIAGQDILDPQYGSAPADISAEDTERYFAPVMITDENGRLNEWLNAYRPPPRQSRVRLPQDLKASAAVPP